MKVRKMPRRDRALCAIGIIALCTACFGPAEPLLTYLYEGSLQPTSGGEVGGSVGMVVGADRTQVGLGVETAPPGARYGWAVRNGTCSGSGTRVAMPALFPAVTIGAGGTGAAETVINRRLEPSQAYATELFAEPEGTGAVIACANLTRLD